MTGPSYVLRLSLLACALAIAPWSALAASQSQEDDIREFKSVMDKRGDTAVPVKFVMTVSGGGSEQQQEGQTQGTLVSADGLILVPGRVVSLDLSAFGRTSGIGGGASSVPSAKSGQFRVRLPGSDEWRTADLVTRDTELGIAWLRLRHPKEKLSYVDFSDTGKVAVGTQLFTVMRTSDQFGVVPIVRVGYVLGETSVPRHEWLVDGSPGIAFDGDGKPLGYVDVDLAGMMRSRNASGSIGMDMGDSVYSMIPADRIGRVTKQAAVLPVVKPSEADNDEEIPPPPQPPARNKLQPSQPAPAHPDEPTKPNTEQPVASPSKDSGRS